MRRAWTVLALLLALPLAVPAAAQEAADPGAADEEGGVGDAGPPGERPEAAGAEGIDESVPDARPPWFGLGMGLLSVAVGVVLLVLLWKQRGDRAP